MSRSRSVAGPASPPEGVPSSLVSSPPAPDCCGQERSRPTGRLSVLGDGQGSDRPDPRWAGAPALARGVVAATAASPASCRHRGARPAARYRLRRDHPPAARDRSAASAPVRSACGGRTRPKTRPQDAMTPVMTCPRSCGGDMSTPRKRSPTRHYLQTTSDNRLSRHVAGSNRDWNRADRSIRCRCAEGSGLAGGRTHDLSGMQGLRAVDHSWAEPVFRHRAVLAGMGCSLAEEVEIRVQDSSAEVRCLVLP